MHWPPFLRLAKGISLLMFLETVVFQSISLIISPAVVTPRFSTRAAGGPMPLIGILCG